MKLKILKYNKEKAIKNFIIFKLAEFIGLFLLIFGFENFGEYICSVVPESWVCPTTYMGYWLLGVLSIILILISLLLVGLILYGVGCLFVLWIKSNWRWAKISAEDENEKKERLIEQAKLKKIKEIDEMYKHREKYGYCKGDEALRVTAGDFGKIGDKYIIEKVYSNGYFDIKHNGKIIEDINPKKFIFIKKQIPKKPKLNNIRQKEIEDASKK